MFPGNSGQEYKNHDRGILLFLGQGTKGFVPFPAFQIFTGDIDLPKDLQWHDVSCRLSRIQ